MTKFEDQLLADLMQEYRPALERTGPAAAVTRRKVPRPAWLVAGAAGLATAATAGVLVAGGASPAFAVTQHPNGTVTISITKMSGIAGANARLRILGLRVEAVPVQPGCTPISALSHPSAPPPGGTSSQGTKSAGGGVTVYVQGIPPGDTGLVIFQQLPDGATSLNVQLVQDPPPSCVSLLAGPPGANQGSGISPRH
jgi:hypothetical protein